MISSLRVTNMTSTSWLYQLILINSHTYKKTLVGLKLQNRTFSKRNLDSHTNFSADTEKSAEIKKNDVSKRQISIKLSSLEKLVSESGHAPVPASALQYIKNHVTKKNDRAERVGTELNKNSLTVSSLITSEDVKAKPPEPKMQAMLSNALPYIQEVAREKERAKKSLALKFKSETLSGVQKLCEEYGEVENIEMFPGHALVEFKTGSSANGMMSEVQPPITSRPSFHSHRARLIHLLGDNLRTSSTTPKFSNAADRLVNKKQLIRSVNKCRTIGECVTTTVDAYQIPNIQVKYNYLLCQQIDDLLYAAMPQSCVIPHGSLLSSLATKYSDLDLVLHPVGLAVYGINELQQSKSNSKFKSFYKRSQMLSNTEEFERDMVYNLSFQLRNFAIGCHKIISLHKARVPIVRFSSEVTGGRSDITCNININDGVLASCLLRRVCEYNVHVRLLCQCIRVWARNHGLTDDQPGKYMINFSLSHLVISFLQSLDVLPSIEHLIQADVEPRNDVTYSIDLEVLGTLYLLFFDYWAKFDYSGAIDIYHGSVIPSKNLSSEFRESSSFLKIIHTQDESFNVARRTGDEYLELFKHLCTRTHKLLFKHKDKRTIGAMFSETHRL
ncbi:MTPAP [Bugula neritina]|uniref:MTPAP n=1 Tax=Bugula neritina TaxID=10212 RepID=A0A7J7J6H5_BUGNE|nr:MTPAP [Bugula neritina]